MLTCKVGKSIVNTITYKEEQLREWSNKGILKCPVCGEKMLYCNGDFKIAYFRHDKNSDCPDIYSEGVTEEHINGIKLLYEWLNNDEKIEYLQLEKWIPETRQRPDIYFVKDGQEYVIEYQCSPIATQYNKRHELYRLQNIKDLWILGLDKYNLRNVNEDHVFSRMKLKSIETSVYKNDNRIIYLNSDNSNLLIVDELEYLWRDKDYYTQLIMKTNFKIHVKYNNLEKLNLDILLDSTDNKQESSLIDILKMKTEELNALFGHKAYTIFRKTKEHNLIGIFKEYDGESCWMNTFDSNNFIIDNVINSNDILNEINNIKISNKLNIIENSKDFENTKNKIQKYISSFDNLYNISLHTTYNNIELNVYFDGNNVLEKDGLLEIYDGGINFFYNFIINSINTHINKINLLKERFKKIDKINRIKENVKNIKPLGKYNSYIMLFYNPSSEEYISLTLSSLNNYNFKIYNNVIIMDKTKFNYDDNNFHTILEKLITDKIREERYGR